MTCDDALKVLPFFLYGEMEFDEEESLQAHLDNCKSCQDAFGLQPSVLHFLQAIANNERVDHRICANHEGLDAVNAILPIRWVLVGAFSNGRHRLPSF